jgi:peptide deformylase
MSVLPVILHPNAVLRKKAEPVTKITPEILQLLDDMLDTMYAEEGIGLAAPQVNVSKRLIVIDVEQPEKAERGNPLKMINPEIIAKSDALTILDEGCLSLPEMRVEVIRPEIVTVRYLDETGATKEIEVDDLLSKALQHEIDHLDGILIFDYLSKLKRDIVLRRYQKMMREMQG